MHILYRQNSDNSFKFREVADLSDYDDSTMDGRLYCKGDENDLWFELDLDNNLYDADDGYVMAFTAYRLEQPDVFAKAQKYDVIATKNSKAGQASASKFTTEERSERAKKAARARWAKKIGYDII